MQDKSFLQAVQELNGRLSSNVQEATLRMLLQQTTASHATSTITDETMRAIVTNELITGQIIALLTLLHDAAILDSERYNEFTAYLRRSVIALHNEISDNQASAS